MSTVKKWLPALMFLFAGSGCAALIYEVVWFQMLELFIGSSAVSVAVLLGTFMGGMCLGSLFAPRVFSMRRHPLRLYAALELGIGVFGVLLSILLPLVGRLYISWDADGAGLLLRGIIAGICLLPPTCAMGATLPVAARWVSQTPAGIACLGWFYASNIVGAVFGSLLAGFYLLRVYDMATATYVAFAVNTVVAVVSLALAAASPSTRLQPDDLTNTEIARTPNTRAMGGRQTAIPAGPPATAVYLAIALSGFCALAGQVIWTRILALLFGATVYTFSIILAVFLFGLGIGSGVGAWIGQSIKRPYVALGWCQLLAVGAIAWTAYMLSSALPFWPVVPAVSPHLRYNFQIDLAHALLAILPAPLLWGVSFPLALASVAYTRDQDPGRLVGDVYAANTIGAILGALSASLLLVASLGSQRAQQIMMGLSVVAGLLVIGAPARGKRTVGNGVGLLGVLGVAAWLILLVPAIPGVLVAYGRNSASWVGHTGEILFLGEGLNSSVAVSRLPTGVLTYHNAGKIQASSQPQDMRLQRMLGHLTTLIPKNPKSVLVIGCGSGITAGAVSIDPRVERQTIVEIERLVPHIASTYFGPYNFEVVENPKVNIQIDDARHYLLTRNETFDVITADPFDPWVRGAATLYTKEFFEAVRARLNPGGVVTMWVPLYTTTPEAVKSQVGTFFGVFPEGFVLGNTYQAKGYDLVLVGQHGFAPIDLDEIDARLERADYAPVRQSFREIGFGSAADLFASYSGRAADLKPWLADAEINRDGNLRLQYLAGLGLNVNEPDAIYQQMLRYRRPPEGLFTGSENRRAQLLSSIGQAATSKPQP